MSSVPLRFLHAHATHPHPELALEIAWAQLASQGATTMEASIGWCYLTEAYSDHAEAVLDSLRARLPGVAWVGGVGVGVLASGVEYIDEPALVVMVSNLPADSFRIFHGRQPLPGPTERLLPDATGWRAHTAQVHADARTADLCDLLSELAERTDTGYLFGGLSTGRQHALHLAFDPREGGRGRLRRRVRRPHRPRLAGHPRL